MAVNEVLDPLRKICGDKNVSLSEAVRDHHGHDESYHKSMPADAVVFPRNTEEVSEVVKLCNANNVPMVPFGTGTGLEGGVTAVEVRIKPFLP